MCHFYQLRTQALASLHCGLQYNQGLPVGHVANWLAMEVCFMDRCGQMLHIFRLLPFLSVLACFYQHCLILLTFVFIIRMRT